MNEKVFKRAFLGSLAADAVSMPVHWYYDRGEIDRVYGNISGYLDPIKPHAGSIMFRSHYKALNEKGDILGDQAQYWGQQGIHYHQFLKAGDNTVNFFLATQLYQQICEQGEYCKESWLKRYIKLMLNPECHRDTYLEEYHRGFFTNYAKGVDPSQCGIDDIHIGGLVQVPALVAALVKVGNTDVDFCVEQARQHVSLTHQSRATVDAAATLVRLLFTIAETDSLLVAIEQDANAYIGPKKLDKWSSKPDRTVIGNHVSPACYLPESFVASLYLAWKYHHDFSAGICANAMVGGDNCHRGVVVGALLGALCGVSDIWLDGLNYKDD